MIKFIILSLTALLLLGPACRADELETAQLSAHTAALRLRDVDFNNCLLNFECASTIRYNGKITMVQKGSMQFARWNIHFMSDSKLIVTDIWSDDHLQKFPDTKENRQLQLAEGRKCFQISYDVSDGNKQIRNLICNYKWNYDVAHSALCSNVHFDDFLATYGTTGISLIDITKSKPSSVRHLSENLKLASFPTECGRLDLTVLNRNGKSTVHTVRLVQTPADLYSNKGKRLGEMKRSVVGDHPGGLTSTIQEVRFEYPEGESKLPFQKITITTKLTAETGEWSATRTLLAKSLSECKSLDEFNALLIPIPEGEKVHSLDPEFKSIALAYRGGDIVRQADGAPLEQVIQERTSRRKWLARATYAGGALLAAGLLYVGYRMIRRRRAKVGGA